MTSTESGNLNQKNESMIFSFKRAQFLSSFRQCQQWSLPDSITYYITKNPSSSKAYQKLVQSCKYFFIKNPILVVERLYHWYADGWMTWFTGGTTGIHLNKVSNKFWITNTFLFHPTSSCGKDVFPSFIPKIYRVEAKLLELLSQIITLEAFLFISSNVETLVLYDITVIDQCGTLVAPEKLVETLPKLKSLSLSANTSTITSKSFKEFLKLPHFLRLQYGSFGKFSEEFDIETFYIYMKKNTRTKVCLQFLDSISEAYKDRLNAIIDEILATETHEYKPPLINYAGLAPEKWEKLYYL